MADFFNALTTMEKVYFFVALAGTVFFLLQSIFTFFDLGETFDFDADFDGDVDADLDFFGFSFPLHLFSIRGIIGFIMIFGWSGLGFSKADLNPLLTFILAFVAGLVMLLIIGLIYFAASKLDDDGNVSIKDAIGKDAQVYLTIPGNKAGKGKVHIVLGGSLREIDAITHQETIKNGQIVQVVDVINETLVVEIKN